MRMRRIEFLAPLARKGVLLLGLTFCLGEGSAAAVQGPAKSPYPTYGVDAKHSNRSAFDGPSALPEIQWVFPFPADLLGAQALSPPSMGEDGTISVGTSGGSRVYSLLALRPDGTQKWEFPTGNGVAGTLAISDKGDAYLNVGDGDPGRKGLVKIDLASGTEEWFFATSDSPFKSSPVIGPGNTVYFGAYDRLIHSVHPSGLEEWQFSLGRITFCSPAIGDDGSIYFAAGQTPFMNGGQATALHPDGTLKWHQTVPDKAYGTLWGPNILDNGNIVIRGTEGSVTALDPAGNVVWQVKHPGATASNTGALSPDGSVLYAKVGAYGSAQGLSLHALDVEDGATLWSFDLGAGVQTSPDSPIVGRDGTIYISGPEATILALDPDGSVRWTKRCAPRDPAGTAISSWPIIGFERDIYSMVRVGSRLRVVCLRDTRAIESEPLSTNPIPIR